MASAVGDPFSDGLKAHPHMLRYACGYALANKGHDTRAIQALSHRMLAPSLCARATYRDLNRSDGSIVLSIFMTLVIQCARKECAESRRARPGRGLSPA
jgi:hypothetical protein